MNIFSVMVVLPLTVFFIFIFLRRRSYPSSLHLSILWSSPGGELLVVTVPHEWTTTKNLLNNNTEPWTFFSVMVVLPLTFFHIHFFEKKVLPFFVSFVNPLVFTRWKGPPGLHRGGGRACPKITARCWEIVSVGQLVVRQFQWEMLGLTLTIFDWTIYDF